MAAEFRLETEKQQKTSWGWAELSSASTDVSLGRLFSWDLGHFGILYILFEFHKHSSGSLKMYSLFGFLIQEKIKI